MQDRKFRHHECLPMPKDEQAAFNILLPLLDLDVRKLRTLEKRIFAMGWASIAYLYPGLHPDGALERGNVSTDCEPHRDVPDLRLLEPYYEISGWPVALVPLAVEAWRRYENGDFVEEEFYRDDAQREGMKFREPMLNNLCVR